MSLGGICRQLAPTKICRQMYGQLKTYKDSAVPFLQGYRIKIILKTGKN